MQESISLKSSGGMEGTKSDFNIRNEGKWGPGGKPWFNSYENLGEKGGGWHARDSLWNKRDVTIFVVGSLQGRKKTRDRVRVITDAGSFPENSSRVGQRPG